MSSEKHVRPETLLPMLRAALERGEGPPAVLAWVRANGPASLRPFDESRVWALADRLAETLSARSATRTMPPEETVRTQFAV